MVYFLIVKEVIKQIKRIRIKYENESIFVNILNLYYYSPFLYFYRNQQIFQSCQKIVNFFIIKNTLNRYTILVFVRGPQDTLFSNLRKEILTKKH